MVRYNNAPPPLTPWRAEVLEAQKQIEAAKKGADRSRSRSRSRSRRRNRGNASKNAQPEETSASSSKKAPSAMAPETGVVLRQARERGEGWYAAVARASESWESVPSNRRRPPAGKGGKQEEVTLEKGKEQGRLDKRGKAKDRPGEREETDGDRHRREELRVDQERQEQRAREEYEARAEERRLKAEDEKRRAEEERQRMEVLKKKRQEKLKGAFAVSDGDDEDEDRESQHARKVAERKKQEIVEAARLSSIPGGQQVMTTAGTALMPRPAPRSVDPELSEKLRFEPGLDPAEAFMRLQERKRKGRRAEFGGPPRGCSPWRDGRKGISWQKPEGEP